MQSYGQAEMQSLNVSVKVRRAVEGARRYIAHRFRFWDRQTPTPRDCSLS